VAAFTLWTEAAFMLVVFLMATRAGRRGGDLAGHRGLMTAITVHAFVAAIELKAGAGIVIEVPDFPISGVVAVFAGRAESSAVDIVVFVAGMAGSRSLVSVERSRVAVFTGGGPMLAEERIFGVPIVIERQRLPAFVSVALVAFLAEI